MDIKFYSSQIQCIKEQPLFIGSQNEETTITVLDNTEAIYIDDGTCNIKWCEENNIPYIQQLNLHNGGCIIGVKGNVFVDAKRKISSGGENLADVFSKALCLYLKSKGLDTIRCDNNDILVDNFKVASGCEMRVNGFQYVGYQISINQDIETIRHACNKEMIKVPKGLSEYGITTDDIKDFCIKYWSVN